MDDLWLYSAYKGSDKKTERKALILAALCFLAGPIFILLILLFCFVI